MPRTKTGQNMLLPRPPWSFHSAGIAYSGKKIVVFGGGVITGSVPLSDFELNAVMIFAVKSIVICAANQTDDTACLNCPSGNSNPTCKARTNPSRAPLPFRAFAARTPSCSVRSRSVGRQVPNSDFV